MKYTIQIENVSRYIMGAVIKSFKDLCPKGVKAIWTEDINNSTDKMKTGKIEIVTKFPNKEKQLYDTKKDIENKLNQLLDKAEAEKKAWFEEQKAKKQAEYHAKKAQEKKEREEELAKRNTFAEFVDKLPIKSSPAKKGKWPQKLKVVDQPLPAPVVVQPKGAWAKGKPTVREVAEEPVQPVVQEKQPVTLPQITPTFGSNLHFGSWADLDEDREYAELDHRFSNSNEAKVCKDGWDDEDSWDDRWDSQQEVY